MHIAKTCAHFQWQKWLLESETGVIIIVHVFIASSQFVENRANYNGLNRNIELFWQIGKSDIVKSRQEYSDIFQTDRRWFFKAQNEDLNALCILIPRNRLSWTWIENFMRGEYAEKSTILIAESMLENDESSHRPMVCLSVFIQFNSILSISEQNIN